MFIAIYTYPLEKESVTVGKVSIFNYLAVALSSLKAPWNRRLVRIKPIKWAEKHFHGVRCFPEQYQDYPYMNADPQYVSIRWIAPWNLRFFLEHTDFVGLWEVEQQYLHALL